MIKTSTVKAMVATLPSTFLAGCFGPSVRNLQTVPTAELAASSVQSFFGDRTMITYDVFHGTQVEYRRPDGRIFFWYPGNGLTIQANWKVGKVAVNSQEICYQYPSNSYNPFLGPKGGNWECQPAWAHTSGMKQVVKSDPFNLGSTRVPYRLEKGQFIAEELFEKSGKSSSSQKNVYPE